MSTAAPGTARMTAYAAGFLANGMWDFLGVAVPLYAVALGASASELGWLVGARAVLPMLFALHGGDMMDRLGVRPVLLAFAAASSVIALAYPMTSQFGLLMVVQLLSGLAAEMSWSGTQTLINQLSRGELPLLARFGFYARLGSMAAPLVAGAAWDAAGAAATFVCAAIWGGLLVVAALAAPRVSNGAAAQVANTGDAELPGRHPPRLYADAIALLAIPAVALVIALSFLRNTPAAMQGSFYIVILDSAGYPGTVIGALVALSELAAAVGSLLAARFADFPLAWMGAAAVASAIAFMTITPLIADLLVALAAAAALRGLAQGVNQPLLAAILAREAGGHQGLALGLRTVAHRLASMVLPVVMGIAVERWGVATGFIAVGLSAMLLCCAVPMIASRRGRSG